MVVLDAESGKVLATPPIGKGVDACAFDPGTGFAFASCGDGTLTVVQEDPAKPGEFAAEKINTQRGARTMALDPKTHADLSGRGGLRGRARPGGGRKAQASQDAARQFRGAQVRALNAVPARDACPPAAGGRRP